MKEKPHRKPIAIRRFLVPGLLLAAASAAHAQSTWNVTGGGSWNNAGNWIGGIPDSDAASATFSRNFTGSPVVTLDRTEGFTLNSISYDDTGASGDSTLTISPGTGGKLILAGTTPTITATSNLILNAVLDGTTGLTKAGAGTLTLNGNNRYTGVTVATAGPVVVSGDQSAATGGWTINGTSAVTFQAGSTIAVGAGRNIAFANGGDARSLTVSGTVTTSATSNLTVRGRSTINFEAGSSWTQGGVMTVQPLNTAFGITLNVRPGSSFTYNGNDTIVLAKSSASGNGSANLNLSGGTFTTTRGFSNTSAGGGAGSTNFNFSAGGTLKLSASIPSLFIEGSSAFNVSTGTGGGVIDTNGFNTTVNVAMAGAGGIEKDGAGTLTLAGTNTYAGDTLVSAGTLFVNGALGDGAVTVEPMAAIGGNGLIGGSLSLAADSLFSVFDLDDALVVGGTITFGSGFGIDNLVGIDWDSLQLETPFTLISTTQTFGSGDIANFGRDNAAAVGNTGRRAFFTDGSLNLVVIPEPGTALLGGLGLLALLRRRRAA